MTQVIALKIATIGSDETYYCDSMAVAVGITSDIVARGDKVVSVEITSHDVLTKLCLEHRPECACCK